MKKVIFVFSLIILGIFVFSACASHQKCPAYGHYSKVETPQGEKIRS